MIIRKAPSQASIPCRHRSAWQSLSTRRHAHAQASRIQPIPNPTPFVPDVKTFFSLIGRGLSQHASKIPDWPALFSLTSVQLRELGVEPPRLRRYLLWWRERFRRGVYGIGGDLKHVKEDGEAEVRVVEVPAGERPEKEQIAKAVGLDPNALSPIMRRMIVNEPAEIVNSKPTADQLHAIEGYKVRGNRMIVGPFIQPVKGTHGSVARIKRQPDMWEVKRGVKIDGGERRKKMVRHKRRLEELKTSRA